jgi:hypothetical protein
MPKMKKQLDDAQFRILRRHTTRTAENKSGKQSTKSTLIGTRLRKKCHTILSETNRGKKCQFGEAYIPCKMSAFESASELNTENMY